MKPAKSDSDRRGGLLGLLLVLAVVFAYQPAWNAGFIWDDDDYVTNNPLITAPDGLQRIWFSTDSPSQYFPLVYTTFRAEHALWGFNASGYHWVNILLHAVTALLVWRLLRRLAIPGAWLAAAIFALHPVQVESVAWITELKNVQSLFFTLLALLAWVSFIESERPVWRTYAFALFVYALALFSKTTACTLPAALLLVLWLKQKPIDARRLAQVVPFVALGFAMGLLTMWWERHHQGTAGAGYAMSPVERVLVASRAVWFYLGKLAWPTDLTFNYPLWKIDAANPFAYGWLLAAAGVAVAIWLAQRWVRGSAVLQPALGTPPVVAARAEAPRYLGRGIAAAMFFYIATLSPLLGFIMLYTFRYTFVADHYQYVAILGPVALAAAGLSVALRERRVLLPALGGLVVLTLAVATWRQSRMYADLETLWRVTLERNPTSFMGHNNLGAIYLGRGEIDPAIAHFERALAILPDNGNARGNLGHALLKKGRFEDAVTNFRQAVALEPASAKAHSDLSFALLQAGKIDEAVIHSQKAVELQPGAAEAWNVLGLVQLQSGQPEAAQMCFAQALELHPQLVDARQNFAHGLLRSGQPAEALGHFQIIADAQPGNDEAQNNLGWALLQGGRIDEAIARFRLALRLRPDVALAHGNLALALLRKGEAGEAHAHYRRAVELADAQPDPGLRAALRAQSKLYEDGAHAAN